MPKTVASQIWPHLAQGTPDEVAHRRTPSVGDAMWPQLSREQKAKDADQRLWTEILERQRESFREGLREANANLDKLAREGKR
jgi:hypothetical protein